MARALMNGLVSASSLLALRSSGDWALFLDLDGTLLDIAATPADVVVPENLIDDLEAASKALDGALAIVSGRPISEIDRLVYPLKFPIAAEHGAAIRFSDGRQNRVDTQFPDEWFDQLVAVLGSEPGIFLEKKYHCATIHFRQAPELENTVRKIAMSFVERKPDQYEVLRAHMAMEIRPKAATKGRAVVHLMSDVPFRGKVPVFVGDDISDEDGIRVCQAMGGLGLRVGEAFSGNPARVRHWLKEIAETRLLGLP